jgi:hypothetical protein
MPPNYTQSVRKHPVDKRGGHNGVNKREHYYTVSCGVEFISLNAAWHHHGPSGVARRVFDEAKESAKEAAKRVSKDAAKEAARPAKEAAKEAARPANGSGKGSGQAGQGSGQGSGHVEYEHREWRRDMLR